MITLKASKRKDIPPVLIKVLDFIKKYILKDARAITLLAVIVCLIVPLIILADKNSDINLKEIEAEKEARKPGYTLIGAEKLDKTELGTLTEFEESVPTPVPTPTPHVPVVTIDYKDIDEPIPYETEYRYDINMKKGNTRIVPGEDGIKTKVYELTFTDGVETSRRLVATKIKKAAKTKIVYEGTIDTQSSSFGGQFTYTTVLECKATAYGNSAKWGDSVAYSDVYKPLIDHLTTRWGVIATDPDVIPKGTKVYIRGLNGTKDYGYAVAADIGGAVKGYIVDLWMDDRSLISAWGLRDVEVYILEDQTVNVFDLRGDYEWTP